MSFFTGWFWVAVILTSPFWFIIVILIIVGIISLFEEIIKALRRRK